MSGSDFIRINAIAACRKDPEHRRAVAATLVHAVTVLHLHRKERRLGFEPEAQKWWRFFRFSLRETLVDHGDGSVFGALFEWDGAPRLCDADPPREVLALRGTDLRSCTPLKDSYTNFNVITNRLHTTYRFSKVMECLRNSINRNGPDRVWVAGHSMGAALGLWAGRTLAAEGCNVDAHLFNPPFASSVKGRWEFKQAILAALADPNDMCDIYNGFLAVRHWIPRLYLNPHDIICSGYVDYFDAYDRRGIKVVRSALQSTRTLLLSALGMKSRPWHIVPSAVQIRSTDVPVFDSHLLSQWWRRRLKTETRKFVLPGHVQLSSLTAVGLYGTD